MALMHPTFPTKDSPFSEIGLFEIFRTQLDESFHVFHSVDYVLSRPNEKVREGQIDFMVLHPSLGLLIVEVKGGQEITYRGDRSQWYSIDHFGRESLIKDPYLQGRRQTHELMEFLRNVSMPGLDASKLSFGHAVVFSDANPHFGSLPMHAEDWMTIVAKDRPRLGEKIRSVMLRWAKGRDVKVLSSKTIEALTNNVFLPVFRLFYSLSDRIEDQERTIWKMTEDQYGLLDYIANRHRALIMGYAGTGKTLLAQEKARRSAVAGKTVLVICYNKPLSEYLSVSINRFNLPVSVETFHSLCRRIIIESGQEFEVDNEDQQFWEDEVPMMMLEALETSVARFDSIVVDEGQDFSANWWPVIEELLSSRERSELYIFFDPLQNLFQKESDFPVKDIPFVLTRNCRNTRHISDMIGKCAGVTIESHGDQPLGDPVIVKTYKNQSQLVGILSQIIRNLTDQGAKPRNIVILCPQVLSQSPLSGCMEINGLRFLDNPFPPQANGIRFSTIGRFKGLEGEIIIALGLSPDVASDKLKLYVASSRAKHMLFVVSKKVIA